MESQSANDAAEQAKAVNAAVSAAARTASTPAWYWLTLGALMGAGVLGISSGNSIAGSVTVIVMLLGGRFLNATMSRSLGIRITRVFGGSANWTVLPWFAGLVVLAVLGRILRANTGVPWPGIVAAVCAVPFTVLIGTQYDRIRLRSHEIQPQ
jgi:hypothetical protein